MTLSLEITHFTLKHNKEGITARISNGIQASYPALTEKGEQNPPGQAEGCSGATALPTIQCCRLVVSRRTVHRLIAMYLGL